MAAVVASALVLVASVPGAPTTWGAPTTPDGWSSNPTFSIVFVGRDGPNGADHYRATLDWGASFFAIAVDSMPLVPAQEAVNLLMEGYRATFPGRSTDDIHPGDSFDFYVPSGTLVCTEWRQRGSLKEFRSLRGDSLVIYTNPLSPIVYRLVRAESPGRAEVEINQEIDLDPRTLAQSLFAPEDPSFKPDFLQLTRAKDLIVNATHTVTLDLSRGHLDDLQEVRAGAEAGGKTEDGMDIYWFRSGEQAQPLFRIDDTIGDRTEPTGLPSLIRVYYYKNGVIRTYQLTSETVFLSGRQPRNEVWAKVYQEYGRVDPLPTRWEIGQPEQDSQAQELGKLGITVLRFQPKEPPKGNFFTHLLDLLMSMMKREQS